MKLPTATHLAIRSPICQPVTETKSASLRHFIEQLVYVIEKGELGPFLELRPT